MSDPFPLDRDWQSFYAVDVDAQGVAYE